MNARNLSCARRDVARLRIRAAAAAGAVMAAAIAPTRAADYPVRSLRIITAEAGGGNDLQARLVARGLTVALGQQVIVENRPSGVMPGDLTAKAVPDGYTLLLYNNALWTGPLMQASPYDPVKDIAPITTVSIAPAVLVVNPSLPVASASALIALARARPGALNYASSGSGSAGHLAAELFKAMAGISIVRVSYKGAGQAMNDLIAGQVQLMFPAAGAAAGHVRAGRVRALAVTSLTPSLLAPDLPPLASVLPGFECLAIYGLFAPAATPPFILQRLHKEAVRALNGPDIHDKLRSAGVDVVGDMPQQLAARIKADTMRMGKVIRDAGIRGD